MATKNANNVCRQCRKFGVKLFLKGDRCLSPKCSFTRRNYGPGTQGVKGKTRNISRRSEYAIQLFEKQKAKAEYGLRERQFSALFRSASRQRDATGEALISLLERRLDNVIYRLGWASSRAAARQLVLHRHIMLNGRIASIPSMLVKPNDKITPKDNSLNIAKTNLPKWLKFDAKAREALVLKAPSRDEIETDIEDQLIIEFYNR